MNREDFPMLKDDFVYFDNAATTLKPKKVIDVMNQYYLKHTSNIHRGDYDFAIQTNKLYPQFLSMHHIGLLHCVPQYEHSIRSQA